MAAGYIKFFVLLIDKKMANSELAERAGFNANIITRLKRDNYISLDSIEKICGVICRWYFEIYSRGRRKN